MLSYVVFTVEEGKATMRLKQGVACVAIAGVLLLSFGLAGCETQEQAQETVDDTNVVDKQPVQVLDPGVYAVSGEGTAVSLAATEDVTYLANVNGFHSFNEAEKMLVSDIDEADIEQVGTSAGKSLIVSQEEEFPSFALIPVEAYGYWAADNKNIEKLDSVGEVSCDEFVEDGYVDVKKINEAVKDYGAEFALCRDYQQALGVFFAAAPTSVPCGGEKTIDVDKRFFAIPYLLKKKQTQILNSDSSNVEWLSDSCAELDVADFQDGYYDLAMIDESYLSSDEVDYPLCSGEFLSHSIIYINNGNLPELSQDSLSFLEASYDGLLPLEPSPKDYAKRVTVHETPCYTLYFNSPVYVDFDESYQDKPKGLEIGFISYIYKENEDYWFAVAVYGTEWGPQGEGEYLKIGLTQDESGRDISVWVEAPAGTSTDELNELAEHVVVR